MSLDSINSLLSGLPSGYSSASASSQSAQSSTVSGLFSKIDQDGNKKWSSGELSDYVSKYNELTGGSLNASDILSKYDSDGDGSLSSTEQASALSAGALGDTAPSVSDASSDSAMLDSALSSSASFGYAIASLKGEADSNLLSGLLHTGSENTSGVFSSSTFAKAAEAYWTSKYGDAERSKSTRVDTSA